MNPIKIMAINTCSIQLDLHPILTWFSNKISKEEKSRTPQSRLSHLYIHLVKPDHSKGFVQGSRCKENAGKQD
jgi:hypothetical protein